MKLHRDHKLTQKTAWVHAPEHGEAWNSGDLGNLLLEWALNLKVET